MHAVKYFKKFKLVIWLYHQTTMNAISADYRAGMTPMSRSAGQGIPLITGCFLGKEMFLVDAGLEN